MRERGRASAIMEWVEGIPNSLSHRSSILTAGGILGLGHLRTSFRAFNKRNSRCCSLREKQLRSDLADIEYKISHEKYSPPYNPIKVPNQETEEESIENLPPEKGTKFEEEIPESVVNLEKFKFD